jgi:hypothetical protein
MVVKVIVIYNLTFTLNNEAIALESFIYIFGMA